MVLERVYVIPHGDEIIDQPNSESVHLFEKIREVTEGDPSESLIVISPHGLRLSKSIGVINTENLAADLQLRTKRLQNEYKTDRELARSILENSVVTQEVSFVTSSGPLSRFVLDFGSVIPLQFFSQSKIVAIGQPRIWNKEMLQEFGKTLAKIAQNSSTKISILISADQAHTHDASGPYGFSEKSAIYEEQIEKCFKESNFGPLLEMEEKFVELAKPDSYWNMLILKGIMDETGMKTVLDYHYIEIYFGMLLGHLVK